MIVIGFKRSKNNFFDTKRVKRAVDKGNRKGLSKFGAYTRTVARNSIKRSKKSSAPGTPPKSHTGWLKKGIYFSFDKIRRAVVIGPVAFKSLSNTTLEALEYGGPSVILGNTEYNKGVKTRKQHRVNVKARPFMRPAHKKVLPRVPEIWKNSII